MVRKNKFKKFFKTIIGSSKFCYKNEIGGFKYIDIQDLVNNIKNNTISEIDAKKSLNALNRIENAEIKYKRLIPKQKESLNLFNDLLDTILTDKTLMSSKDNEKENKKLNEENENEHENENEDEDETMSQNEKNEIMKGKNDILDEVIDKSKSFEEQMESLKKLERLKGYWY